jgi:hypothetical protein
MINFSAWAESLSEHRIAASRMGFTPDKFYGLRAVDTFPTGAAFLVNVNSLDEGHQILKKLEHGP